MLWVTGASLKEHWREGWICLAVEFRYQQTFSRIRLQLLTEQYKLAYLITYWKNASKNKSCDRYHIKFLWHNCLFFWYSPARLPTLAEPQGHWLVGGLTWARIFRLSVWLLWCYLFRWWKRFVVCPVLVGTDCQHSLYTILICSSMCLRYPKPFSYNWHCVTFFVNNFLSFGG